MDKTVNTNGAKDTATYSWDEIKRHSTAESRWIVIDKEVFDITTFVKRHPGGPRVIGHYAGQDASVSYIFEKNRCRRQLLAICVCCFGK